MKKKEREGERSNEYFIKRLVKPEKDSASYD